jgi:GTPase SAR1 family protein
MQQSRERVKLGLIGPPGVGKTHFVHSFIFGNPSLKAIDPTIAVEFY